MKIAIISNTFYPDPVVAAIRMTELARSLNSNGHEVTIICRHHGHTATIEQVQENVGRNISIDYLEKRPIKYMSTPSFRTKIAKTAKSIISERLLDSLVVPDIGRLFWQRNLKNIEQILNRKKAQVVVTSSPGHSVHFVGLALKKKLPNLSWVADFRDPYLIDERYKPKGVGKLFFSYHRTFLDQIYKNADAIVHAIPTENRWARLSFPKYRSKFNLILNGAPDWISSVVANTPRNHNHDSINITSVGQVGPESLENVAVAIKELHEEGNALKLNIIGPIPHNANRISSILGDKVTFFGQLTHQQALTYLNKNSDILLSVLDTDRKRTLGLSSKLFEYFYTGLPVVQVNPTRPDSHLSATVLNSFSVCNGTQPYKIKCAFVNALKSLREGSLVANPKYLRSEQNKHFHRILDQL